MAEETDIGRPRQTLRDLGALRDHGLLVGGPADLGTVAERYAIAIPPAMAALVDPTDPGDPIARQFIPSAAEATTLPDEHADPIGDDANSPSPGLVHRYTDRVLIKAASVCPVYCRFCFRREMIGPDKGGPLSEHDLAAAIAYIARNPEIWEVIVTGGDPLVLSERRIADLGERISAIDHVKVVRWHTRVPAVAPETVTDGLADALARPLALGKAVYVSLHANHARELTPSARAACRRLQARGIAMVSQSVLLRGVNDTPGTLGNLMRAFVETGVRPYYLHMLDRAPGTSHFRVPLAEARDLMRALRGHLSGLCQPTLVIDIPGGHGKVVVGADDPVIEDDTAVLIDRHGRRHRYSLT